MKALLAAAALLALIGCATPGRAPQYEGDYAIPETQDGTLCGVQCQQAYRGCMRVAQNYALCRSQRLECRSHCPGAEWVPPWAKQ